ncbi:MAG: hypothetical protein GY743_23790 [Planctomycetaceae bacterium]|nr:hypothetical protein [Planctomycetaceae bacterium]
MGKQITFGHILTILGIIIIPLIIWGINVEKRFVKVIENTQDIEVLKVDYKSSSKAIQRNHNEVMYGLHKIELQLKDKKDRE